MDFRIQRFSDRFRRSGEDARDRLASPFLLYTIGVLKRKPRCASLLCKELNQPALMRGLASLNLVFLDLNQSSTSPQQVLSQS